MGQFTIKAGDTRPILQVALKDPDGSAHDLTGSTSWKLHVRVSPSVTFTRDMVKEGADTDGVLRYTWVSTDWDPGNLPTPLTSFRTIELYMEYEVIGGASSGMRFPNARFDTLVIRRPVGVEEALAVGTPSFGALTLVATATVV
jgi:hypothetical protein